MAMNSDQDTDSPLWPFPGLVTGLGLITAVAAIGGIAVVVFALPAAAGAVFVGAAVLALLLLLGAAGFYIHTYLMKLEYQTNAARAAAKYGFPNYRAWYNAQSWVVRAAACGP